MPRKKSPPRLWLDRQRHQWLIKDGANRIRTSCAESDRSTAERRLAQYLADKYAPTPSADPLIADILLAYSNEHLKNTKAVANAAYNVGSLGQWWIGKTLADVTPDNCRTYSNGRTHAAARRDLETLRAAINHWHKFHGPLPTVPAIILPPKSAPRERWLTREEAKRLRHAAMQWPHLYRFIIIALLTGTRSGAILSMQWSWVDLDRRLMRRRASGQVEDRQKRTPPVRISEKLVRLMRRWKRDGSSYVVHYNGQQIGEVRKAFAKACAAAGLGDDVTPHILRHTRATWIMQAGKDPWQAAGHLGMTVTTLTRTYGHHHVDYQRDVVDV